MLATQKYWELTILEKTYHLSPYLIFNGLGFIFGLFLLDFKLKNTFKKEHDKIYIFYVMSIVAGWLGAHIFDVLLKNDNFGQAGFTFLGGLIFGTTFFIILFLSYYSKSNLIDALNVGVMPLVLAHAIGRIGCYFSGCCYGKLIDHSSFLFSLSIRHPTQLYESFFLFILFVFMSLKDKIKCCIPDIYIYFISYGTFRMFIEILRGDFRGQYLYGLSPSQWISLFIVIGTFIYLVIKKRIKYLISHSTYSPFR